MNEKLIVEQIAGMRWQVKRYENGTIRGSGFTKEQAKRDFLAQEIAFTTNAQANGFIRLAPDEVVIKRATAETAYSWVMGFVGSGGMTQNDDAAKDDLESALNREVTP